MSLKSKKKMSVWNNALVKVTEKFCLSFTFLRTNSTFASITRIECFFGEEKKGK